MNNKHALWVEKYRPTSLENYIFHDDNQKQAINRMISDGSIPHLLLSGVQGSGKTTLAFILVRELGIDPNDVMVINASDENSVDVMRDKIKMFISTIADSPFKVVHLEEADNISGAGQAVLRRMMEEYADNARFILTCNHEHRIIAPIKSRCQHYRFLKHEVNKVTECVAKILLHEKVKFDLDVLDKYVRSGYPDIRKIINLLQQNSVDGQLLSPTSENAEGTDYKIHLLEMIEQDDWEGARKLTCAQVAPEEWEDVYRFLYENIEKSKKFENKDKWESAIVVIAEHLYKHYVYADPEINAAAMFISLSQI